LGRTRDTGSLLVVEAEFVPVPLRLADPFRQLQKLRDHLGRRNLLVRVGEHRLFQRLTEFLGLHEVGPLADLDLVVEQFPQRLEREVLLLQQVRSGEALFRKKALGGKAAQGLLALGFF
jgi:hypothetical protein